MCGIAGFVLGPSISDPDVTLAAMTDTLRHRGPDGHGYWSDSARRVFFGHRRLAVVDLSENGRQPMLSTSGRFAMTFNGEVYNFKSLRDQLVSLGHHFRGGSDTEVMLAAFEQWSVPDATRKFLGMFAFAVWDDFEKALYFGRDRFGKKPLYVSTVGQSVVFGSELKSLKAFPGFDRTIDRNSVALYLRHNYIPSPDSVYVKTTKLRPGSIVKFDCRALPALVQEDRFWTPSVLNEPYRGTFEDAAREFELLLTDAVKVRMVADVPLGAFLSGGIDSSLVVALMARQSSFPVKTFTIGFDAAGYDEAQFARQVSRHLKTDHTEVYVTGAEAMSVIPRLPIIYDEPFADSSQIPTYLVSRLARSDVTVALSGDGGDELGCGYDRYLWMRTLWQIIRTVPRPVRRMIASVLQGGGAGAADALFRVIRPLVSGNPPRAQFRDRLLKLAAALSADDARGTYRQLLSHWQNPLDIVIGAMAPLRDVAASVQGNSLDELVNSLMITDASNYLPDDILTKVDRASMANSLEVRAPLLDHRLHDLSRRMPMHFHEKGKQGKQLLRASLSKHLPRTLIDRPKMGFGVPLASWLRRALKEWADDLLSERRLTREGIFDARRVRTVWTQFLSGHNDSHYLLWDVLMFQAWLEEESKGATAGR